MATAKYPGIKINLGGVDYIIPPISLGALQQLQSRVAAFEGGADSESVSTVIDVTHSALKRNYPEITVAQVSDMVDLGNMMDIFEMVMDVSGLKRKAIEASGGVTPGEV